MTSESCQQFSCTNTSVVRTGYVSAEQSSSLAAVGACFYSLSTQESANETCAYTDSDDADSVCSYYTAEEETESQEQIQSHTIATSQGVTENSGIHWLNLVQQHGENPGVDYVDDEVEVFNLPLPKVNDVIGCLAGPDCQTQTRIEGFSGARLDFLTFPTPNEYGIRITGTVAQAYYAIQACNAVIADEIDPISHWVILKFDGPRYRETAYALQKGLSDAFSLKGFVEIDQLHVTVASVYLPKSHRLVELCQLLELIVNEIHEKMAYTNFVGYLDRIRYLSTSSISLAPSEKYDPIILVVEFMRQRLRENGFGLCHIGEVHMTVLTSRLRGECKRRNVKLDPAILAQLGLSLNFGPMQITGVNVSCRRTQLEGYKFTDLAEFSLNPYNPL